MPLDLFLAFLAASTLLFVKPGPAMSVIVANSIGQGMRGGLVTVAGNVFGFVLLISLVALGLAWIADTMKTWFDWIRLGGAAFLLYLGATRLWFAGKAGLSGPQPTGCLFRDGFLVAVANPEVILFLAAFLPPFVDPNRPAAPQLSILGVTFIAVSAIIGAILAVTAAQARSFLSDERLVWLDRISGGLLVIAALWLAWPR
ncbi:LysE family translocator [Taklimakanibacter lacteus]|uniref:LysE family translocator n=1 Tax=Taklimakanibacter lacteus TaxID=2268456 RepID=UPI0013C42FE8